MSKNGSTSLVLAAAGSANAAIPGFVTVAGSLLLAGTLPRSSSMPGPVNALNTALSILFYLLPISVGLGVLAAIQVHKSGMAAVARTSNSGLSRLLFMAWVSATSWMLIAYTCMTVVLLVRWTFALPGNWRMLLLVLSAVLQLSASVATGVAIGHRARSAWAAPIATVLTFGWLLLANTVIAGEGNTRSAIVTGAFNGTSFDVMYEPPRAALSIHLLIAVGLFIGAWATMTSQGRLLLGFTASAILAVAVVAATRYAPGYTDVRAAPDQPACESRSDVTFCAWPTERPYLDALLDGLLTAKATASSYFDVPTEFRQVGIDHPLPTAKEVSLSTVGGTEPPRPARYIAAVLPWRDVDGCRDEPALTARRNVQKFISYQLGQRGDLIPALDSEIIAQLRKPVETQRQWIQLQVGRARIDGCS
jgi:hypothetical protein